MKQKALIIVGITLLSLLIALGVYLFFFYGTTDGDQFTDLGPEGQTDGGVVIPPTLQPENEDTTPAIRPRLRQLTTKPVIGFVEVGSPTSTLSVRFAEAGTGHIFTVNTETGEEVRISNTTIPEASQASFSPSGQTVALRVKNDRRTSPLTIGTLQEGGTGLTVTELRKEVIDFKIVNEQELLYTLKTSEGTENRVYTIATQSDSVLFSVPFYEVNLNFGPTSTSTHYAIPKPAHTLEGYVYSFTGSRMNREPIAGFGLMALNTPGYTSYTRTENFIARSYIFKHASSTTIDSSATIIPEKCTQGSDLSFIWCGYQLTELPPEFPDAWYRGNYSFADSIWRIDLESGSALSLVDTLAESGREIDVTAMAIGSSETALYFINKNDNTLWMYEL